jgi:hypothetical protein
MDAHRAPSKAFAARFAAQHTDLALARQLFRRFARRGKYCAVFAVPRRNTLRYCAHACFPKGYRGSMPVDFQRSAESLLAMSRARAAAGSPAVLLAEIATS